MPEEGSAVDAAWIHFVLQSAETALRQQRAEPGGPGARHRFAQPRPDLAGGALCRLQGDVAGEALDDDDVDLAGADIVAFDIAAIFDRQALHLLQPEMGFLDLFRALDFLDADIQQADLGTIDMEQCAGHAGTHQGKVAELLGIGADVGADVENDRFGADRRPDRGNRGALDIAERLEQEAIERHQRAGVAGGDCDGSPALAHGLKGQPHARPLAAADRMARLVGHADGVGGVDDLDAAYERLFLVHERTDAGFIAEHDVADAGMSHR